MRVEAILGICLALAALAWIVRACVGIRRRQVTAYGRGGFRHTAHGHAAVWAGLVQVGIGLAFFALGLGLVYLGAQPA
jgi:hypothetical protein